MDTVSQGIELIDKVLDSVSAARKDIIRRKDQLEKLKNDFIATTNNERRFEILTEVLRVAQARLFYSNTSVGRLVELQAKLWIED